MISLTHLVFTSTMVGIIWVIQLVHYPSFYFIRKDIFVSFQKFHTDKITIIVAPVMLIELITGILLIYMETNIDIALSISLFILIAIWVLTAIYFYKAHQKLMSGYNEEIINQLIKLNWIRTILWTFRLILFFIYFV
ncbi:MAG: hypothetical protein ACKVHD_08650 [Alphaproteobacteria bacterium]|jgi:uncharacterized membrane protein (DUF485 family)